MFAYPSGLLYLNSALALASAPSLTPGEAIADSPSLRRRMRLVTAAFGIASVLAVFFAARLLLGDIAGLVAATFIAINPLHITNSLPVTTDVPAGFGVAMVLLFSALILVRGQTLGGYALAGAMVGLATGLKYTGVLSAVTVIAAHLARARWHPLGLLDKRLIAAGLCSIVVFLATTPYAVLDYDSFSSALTSHSTRSASIHPGADSAGDNSYDRYAVWMLDLLGPVGMGCMAFGIVVAARINPNYALILLLFPLVYVGFLGSYKVGWDRYVVLALPAMAVAAAAVVRLPELFRARRLRLMSGAVGTALALACISVLIPRAWLSARLPLLPDVRVLAEDWIQSNLPAGAYIAREYYTPPIAGDRFRVANLQTFGLLREPNPNRYHFLVTSSGDYGRFVNHRDRYPDAARHYDMLFAHFTELKRFEPVYATGPTIRILVTKKGKRLLEANSGLPLAGDGNQ